jgi:PAS domain S-box-containing protein
VVGRSLYEYFGAEDEAVRPIKAIKNALAGESDGYEFTYQGNVYETLVEPLRDAEGRIEGALGVALDITDRKQAEATLRDAHDKLERRVAERTRELRAANRQLREDIEERKRIAAKLQESEARFRVLVEDSPIPVGITEPGEGKLLYVNPRLADFFGLPEDELMGRQVTEFYEEPEDRTTLLETMRRDGFVRDFDIRLRRADGELVWASISMSNIDFDGGKCFYAGLVDVTKTKQAEESLRAERRLLKRLLELHERDRQLIAYEIHDGIVQDMTAAGMFVEAALHAIPEKPAICTRLEQSAKLLRASIAEARRMINGLRPPILEDEGLVAAIENLVDEISSTANLDVELRHNVQFGRIAPALEMAIYRVVQEGLNNVWQHSGSRAARIEMNQQGEEVRITVQDWGCGFDPTKVTAKRYGLLGIRERARLLGGRAQISSSPGQGTRIDVSLPLSDVLLP